MKKINKVIHNTQYDDQFFFEYIEYPEFDFEASKAKLIHSQYAEVEKSEKKISSPSLRILFLQFY